MSKPRPQWQVHAIAAQKRDNEMKRTEELKKTANYFEINTRASRHHEQWTTDGYYKKKNKEAEDLSVQKIKTAKLEERRKKLELMLHQEKMELQQEMKVLSAQPKLFKNGSYLNSVPTATLEAVNHGIRAKEAALRRAEGELRLHHAWRLRQPELRAARSGLAHGRLKSAWMEQIVEKEVQKEKEEEDMRRSLQERDEALRKQIEAEQERLKEKELQMMELRSSLEGQIAELSDKEDAAKEMRREEERELLKLDELKHLAEERERELKRLTAERDATIVNMGLHKYKLKKRVLSVLEEIQIDLELVERMRRAIIKDAELERDKCPAQRRVLDDARAQLEEHRERERERQKNIDAMYDGEARQINEKQDKLWSLERDARAALLQSVLSSLARQLRERADAARRRRRDNVLQREQLLAAMEEYQREVGCREREQQLQAAGRGRVNALQAQLSGLHVQRDAMQEASRREEAAREAARRERDVRAEIARLQRGGSAGLGGLTGGAGEPGEGRRRAWE